MEEIIQISHAVKKFGKATVLQDVSLDVKKGSICGIVGETAAERRCFLRPCADFMI